MLSKVQRGLRNRERYDRASDVEPQMTQLELISHHLCPYVQRAAITLAEKQAEHRRTYVDLARKPDWFLALSPLGKVPLLRVGGRTLFESAAICEYLDETLQPTMLPADPITRAEHRAWISFASATLDAIGGLYSAGDEASFEAKALDLADKFERLEAVLGQGPYFAGAAFSLVDAAFAPAFRYFDVIERHVRLDVFARTPKVRAWRAALYRRPSVQAAVSADYAERLDSFVRARRSHLAGLMGRSGACPRSSEPEKVAAC
jgi:glutathione S-transferase